MNKYDSHKRLLEAASQVRLNAYANYSEFKVGAAVLTKDNQIFTGCNIENTSYGATMCAERVAIFKAISEGFRKIEAIAIIADLSHPIAPCGMCLQVMNEFGSNATVIMGNTNGDIEVSQVKELLPKGFII